MNIKKGKIVVNRTRLYLVPLLKNYGSQFKRHFNQINKLAFGINDGILVNVDVQYSNHIFVLTDNTSLDEGIKAHHNESIKWLKKHSSFQGNYDYSLNEDYEMLIFKLPNTYYRAVEMFLNGTYSSIVGKKDWDTYYDPRSQIYRIISKNEQQKVEFLNQVNKTYNTQFSDWDGEYDFKPQVEQETFNPHLYGQFKDHYLMVDFII